MKTVLVTGSTGFVGVSLIQHLAGRGFPVRAVTRREMPVASGVEWVRIGEIGADTDWSAALGGVDTVVHLAARAHVMNDPAANPLSEYRRINVAGTERLACEAARAGVRRFVFLSSIKVNGEQTQPSKPFRETDSPAPLDAYGQSKYEAEQVVLAIARASGMQVVVIRPPLVYGPGVKGNMARLVNLVRRGIPLPLGGLNNRRSLIGLDNLVDVIARCILHPAAGGKVFLVSDGDDLSTPELLRRLAVVMGRPSRLLPVPVALLRIAGRFTGRSSEVERLVGSLQVDIRHAKITLQWRPPVPVHEGLERMIRAS